MNRRPRYKAQEPTVTASDLLDSTDGSTRRFIGQTGQVEERAATKSGFVVGAGPNGQPSYQFRTSAGAPLAEDKSAFTPDAQWAKTFGGNSPLGVAAGIAPATNPAIQSASDRIYGRNGNNPSIEFLGDQAVPYGTKNYLAGGDYPTLSGDAPTSTTTAPVSSIDDVIAQGEAYHKANGIPLPDMNNPNQTLYPDSGGSGAIFGNPAGDAANTLLKYGEPGESAFTQYGGQTPPSGGVTKTTYADQSEDD